MAGWGTDRQSQRQKAPGHLQGEWGSPGGEDGLATILGRGTQRPRPAPAVGFSKRLLLGEERGLEEKGWRARWLRCFILTALGQNAEASGRCISERCNLDKPCRGGQAACIATEDHALSLWGILRGAAIPPSCRRGSKGMERLGCCPIPAHNPSPNLGFLPFLPDTNTIT